MKKEGAARTIITLNCMTRSHDRTTCKLYQLEGPNEVLLVELMGNLASMAMSANLTRERGCCRCGRHQHQGIVLYH